MKHHLRISDAHTCMMRGTQSGHPVIVFTGRNSKGSLASATIVLDDVTAYLLGRIMNRHAQRTKRRNADKGQLKLKVA